MSTKSVFCENYGIPNIMEIVLQLSVFIHLPTAEAIYQAGTPYTGKQQRRKQ